MITFPDNEYAALCEVRRAEQRAITKTYSSLGSPYISTASDDGAMSIVTDILKEWGRYTDGKRTC